MRAILLCSILAAMAPAAQAGDWNFRFRIEDIFGNGRRQHRQHRQHRHQDECRQYRCERRYECGHYETVRREVVIPAEYRIVHVPAVYEWRYDRCGNAYRVLVRPACTREVLVRPERVEVVCEQVYVPGRWVYDCDTPGHRHPR
ncbi:MAG: hypothetical protein ACT4PV_02610 [Planctomycetaceae bacterium]